MIGEDKVIKFTGCKKNEACAIILRGAGTHILDEAERSLHDALCVLVNTVKSSRVVYGGGNVEMQCAAACDNLAKKVSGKQVTTIDTF
jgi:T-complex protein 1 subunit beta